MWWFEAAGRVRLTPLAAASVLLALAACTSGPLYGTTAVDPVTGARSGILSELRGRLAVSGASTRTDQVFRNALLFRLNGAERVRDPLYEVRFIAVGNDQVVSIESGSGIPAANVYRMTVDYSLVRLSDGETIATGQRFAMAPYDRTGQAFAASRALLDAREQAGRAVADRITQVLAPILQRQAFAAGTG